MNLRNHPFLSRHTVVSVVTFLLIGSGHLDAETASDPFPFSEIGARATGDYRGEAIGIRRSSDGATLHSAFQRLAGTVTSSGLAVESTEGGGGGLRLSARALARGTAAGRVELAATGAVEVGERTVTWTRPGLVEEYSVSVDGLRQDFIVAKSPAGLGALSVELGLEGATAEATAGGVRLTLDGSGRELVYNRLHVIDAAGRELEATLEALATNRLAVRVEDGGAVYPVRIDPTFSDADWVSMNPGLPGTSGLVRAAVVDNNGNLFIGGSFTLVGSVAANNIAKWNGSEWSALGSGMDDPVTALAVMGSDLYAGGKFTTAGGTPAKWIAKWNGSEWSALGTGMEGEKGDIGVHALAVIGVDLYAGGKFTTAGGTTVNDIAKWDGTEWSALASGMTGDRWQVSVQALAVINGDLYAGGRFAEAGGTPANNIAKWNGTEWSALGSGIVREGAGSDESVRVLAVSGSELYAGGAFADAGGVPAKNIAKWDGSEWSALGSGVMHVETAKGSQFYVEALAAIGGNVYVGGDITTAGRNPVNGIAKWNGSEWSALGSGVMGGDPNGTILALEVIGSDLFVGGYFGTAGGTRANHIAKWNGSEWSAMGSRMAMDRDVSAVAVIDNDLYVGGRFTTAGGIVSKGIAKWNGSDWSALGSGMMLDGRPGSVNALAVNGGDLYAGGRFAEAGGTPANNIAKWNGNEWSALDSGIGTDNAGSGSVSAVAVVGGDLYVGGYFTTAGGTPASNIAKWNGTEWSPLGLGVGSADRYESVLVLAKSGTDLFAGGRFDTAGGTPAKNIAKWNGTEWSAMASGMTGDLQVQVYALATFGGDLYIGGNFTAVGDVPANGIAKWNGTEWLTLGSGLTHDKRSARVHSLAVRGNDLYVGGNFATAVGTPPENIAKWNGSEWLTMGTGVNGSVSALAVLGSDLYVGGNFTTAGTTVSPYLVRATNLSPDPEKTGPPEWTSKDGRVIRAEFVELSGEAVVIRREDGQVFTVPFSTLSPASVEQAMKLSEQPK